MQAEKYKWIYKEKNFYKSEIEILFKELLKAQEEKKKIYILAETKEKAINRIYRLYLGTKDKRCWQN